MDSTQKVAIITGASRGIGAGLVAAYRKLGYAVVATSRSVDSSDPEVLAVPGDLSRPGTGADVVEHALNRFGRIDTLVNDAGVFIAKPFTDYTDEDYDTVRATRPSVRRAGGRRAQPVQLPPQRRRYLAGTRRHLLRGAGHGLATGLLGPGTGLIGGAGGAAYGASQSRRKGGDIRYRHDRGRTRVEGRPAGCDPSAGARDARRGTGVPGVRVHG